MAPSSRPRAARRTAAVLAAGVLALGSTLAAAAANAADAPAADAASTAALPYVLGIQGAGGSSSVAVTLPQGAVPRTFDATVRTTYTFDGTIVLTVNGRRFAQVPAKTGGAVHAALQPGDVDQGLSIIGMYVQLDPQADCFVDDTSTATLVDGVMGFTHPVTPPTTIGSFLSPGLDQLTVQIGTQATAAEQQAGLDAVAALVHRFPAPTLVRLRVSDAAPSDDFLSRTVVVKATPQAASTSGSASPSTTSAPAGGTLQVREDGALVVTGTSDSLAAATFALADPALSLVQDGRLDHVAGTPDWNPAAATTSLAELGAGALSMSGVGRVTSTIAIGQPAFGQPLSALQISLLGVVTPLPPGASGRVDFIWNGNLIGSVGMSQSTTLSQQLSIPAEQLNRDNELTVAMSYVPPSGVCTPRPLAARLDIDAQRSTVIASYGDSMAPGFQRFPQVLGAGIPIALGPLGQPSALLQQAGDLVAALASSTPEQLTVSLMTSSAFEEGGMPGLLLGAGPEDTAALGAPFTGDEITQVREPDPIFTAALPGPLALAQAFSHDGRDVVLLGPIPPDAASASGQAALELTDELAEHLAVTPGRWTLLSGQVVSMGATGQLESIALPPQPAPTTSGTAFVVISLIATAFLVIAIVVWSLTKPSRPDSDLPGLSTTE